MTTGDLIEIMKTVGSSGQGITADQVWNDPLSDNITAGSAGKALADLSAGNGATAD